MQTYTRLAATGFMAALLMALAVSSASAGRLSVSNQSLRITWATIEFFAEGGSEATVRCHLTLEGSFHSRTIAKVVGSLLGYITRAIIAPREQCTGGAWTVLAATLPWHMTYDGFEGTLPNISGIRLGLRRTAYLTEVGLGTSCLYQEGGAGRTARFTAHREAGGRITGMTADETIRLARVSGTFGCPTEQGFRGTGTVALLGTTTPITITLI
jgi:hypothetical protein